MYRKLFASLLWGGLLTVPAYAWQVGEFKSGMPRSEIESTLKSWNFFKVAAVGSDRVIIGTPFDGTNDPGAAYLFGTDGAWAATFINPTPAGGDNFGFSVAAAGTDRVVIGAPYDDTGAPDTGAAYLFSVNGTLLTTFTNPASQATANFGWSGHGVLELLLFT